MGFREIKQPQDPLSELYQNPPAQDGEFIRLERNDPLFMPERDYGAGNKWLFRLRQLFRFPMVDTKSIKMVAIRVPVSLLLIYFGITQSGSYFGPASGRFSGALATIFYQWQLGTILAMIGLIVIYDTIRKYR